MTEKITMVWRSGGGFKVRAIVGYLSQYNSTPSGLHVHVHVHVHACVQNTSRHVLVNIFCITRALLSIWEF